MHVVLDLDGVLVDFVQGALDVHNIKTSIEELYRENFGEWDIVKILGMSAPAFWRPMDFEFWSKLEWTCDGQEILALIEKMVGRENITLWTSPSQNYGCHDGKLRWVERHLPRHYKHNIIFGAKKELGASCDTILIDDSDKNVSRFVSRNGHGVLVPRIWNSEHHNRNFALTQIGRKLYEAKRMVEHKCWSCGRACSG